MRFMKTVAKCLVASNSMVSIATLRRITEDSFQMKSQACQETSTRVYRGRIQKISDYLKYFLQQHEFEPVQQDYDHSY